VPAQRVVGSFLDHLTVERGASPNTVAAYRRDLARYLAFLQARGIDELTAVSEADVGAFAVSLREVTQGRPALAPTSVARALSAVKPAAIGAASENSLADHSRSSGQGARAAVNPSAQIVRPLLSSDPQSSSHRRS